MGLNKSKGQMYPWITHTWNPIRGRCPHDCVYCYMKKFPVGELRFEEDELNTNLGRDRIIFVGSSTDMFAQEVTTGWIEAVLWHCKGFPKNQYLFQSKNPKRFLNFDDQFPPNVILGTTIETTDLALSFRISSAPSVAQRYMAMKMLDGKYGKMISLEPIMDFDLQVMIWWMEILHPKFISIGADSKGHNLPEPSPKKLKELIRQLKTSTEVKLKTNLNRILRG